jgi:hypothetical protein
MKITFVKAIGVHGPNLLHFPPPIASVVHEHVANGVDEARALGLRVFARVRPLSLQFLRCVGLGASGFQAQGL